jgi:hypothetical protein
MKYGPGPVISIETLSPAASEIPIVALTFDAPKYTVAPSASKMTGLAIWLSAKTRRAAVVTLTADEATKLAQFKLLIF